MSFLIFVCCFWAIKAERMTVFQTCSTHTDMINGPKIVTLFLWRSRRVLKFSTKMNRR
jgi:hypothetical protein